jgi:hypothetical protein
MTPPYARTFLNLLQGLTPLCCGHNVFSGLKQCLAWRTAALLKNKEALGKHKPFAPCLARLETQTCHFNINYFGIWALGQFWPLYCVLLPPGLCRMRFSLLRQSPCSFLQQVSSSWAVSLANRRQTMVIFISFRGNATNDRRSATR